MANTNPVIGVVLLARHGDRAGFYQNPNTYAASKTSITPLGEQQLYRVGNMLRTIYADPSSDRAIQGLSNSTLNAAQINSTADGGGEGGVIFDSAVALWQGFYPPNATVSSETLADGTNVTSPLNGYQTLQINTVLPADDVDFESWVNCGTWTNRTNEFYNSTVFLAKTAESAPFLKSLQTAGLVGGRNVSLVNAYNLYDFINVQRIHNATYSALLDANGPDTLNAMRALADFHEYGSFTDSTDSGIGNIAGRTFLPRVLASFDQFANGTEVKIAHYQMSYKPFLSIFNMTDMSATGFAGATAIVDYGSVATFELRKSMTNSTGFDVRFGFRNGSFDGTIPFDFTYYPLFGSSSVDIPLASFETQLASSIIPNTTAWCHACSNTLNSGCATVALADKYEKLFQQSSSESHFSPVGAGFIGFAVTAVLGALILLLLARLGWVSFGSRQQRNRDLYLLRQGGPAKNVAGEDAGSVASSHF
ncbi:BZ3500_MvSof-1268-A1-R1_Chr2-1g04276 [Microbotryum saponariae]|uniref:BZ3500_MvSof-1268-A1-R1_Chr2-1g04276 protein n=1 Tax=Microbotryum saponariae TaxID=289078 RepID=A0A2X0M990_9BASI|nr:BZ3500_MvSof-1268-A1-R1_Chr2-1g04276 [Microbotryum saponariae]SCZ91294.1 BZ3501_MvSof-1269-A2-R1_Chr2-1g03932 [Microbotryum saponariae]